MRSDIRSQRSCVNDELPHSGDGRARLESGRADKDGAHAESAGLRQGCHYPTHLDMTLRIAERMKPLCVASAPGGGAI
jgi:hypothetical protein